MSRYSTVSVEINVPDIIGDIDTDDLIDELRERGDLVNILDEFEIEEIQTHVESRGGFTLENVPTEDLQGALAERNVKPQVPVEVIDAINLLFDYFNLKTPMGSRVDTPWATLIG